MTYDLNKLARDIHEGNAHWWTDLDTGERIDRNVDQMLMLIVSEIAEAMEGERKDLMDDKLPHRIMAEVELADALIRVFDFAGAYGHQLELDDSKPSLVNEGNKGAMLFALVRRVYIVWYAIRIESGTLIGEYISWLILGLIQYCDHWNYDIFGAMDEKLEYNRHRADHKIEHRKAAGGKKW